MRARKELIQDWVNQFNENKPNNISINDFYKKIQTLAEDSPLKIYQVLVQNYLGLNTPYRGLLVYHGLGTGKTATAVTTAEGLSVNMDITTLLPASLESNFIDEVKKYGNEIYKRTNR